MVIFTAIRRTGLKSHCIRKVENHCSKDTGWATGCCRQLGDTSKSAHCVASTLLLKRHPSPCDTRRKMNSMSEDCVFPKKEELSRTISKNCYFRQKLCFNTFLSRLVSCCLYSPATPQSGVYGHHSLEWLGCLKKKKEVCLRVNTKLEFIWEELGLG